LKEKPNKILIHNNQTFIFTRHTIYFIEDNEIKSIHKIEGTFFQALSHNNNLYYVSKVTETNQFIFKLFKLGCNKDFIEIETEIYRRSNKRNLHEAIPSPLKYGEEHSHPIGNSYGEIQIYGGSPYLHPGVDFLGVENENVYAVKNGVVKAVLSTGGTYYWRIAIANENTNLETTGYLYAHLIETSIPFIPGDEVSAGDIVGELIFWPWYSFTHLHFARIKSQGEIWDGAWWTSNDPLVDVTGYVDDTPPTFENAKEENLFAFRDESGNYLNPLELSDDIRIICKAHDIANSNWKIDVSELGYKIYSADEPTVPLVEKISFAYDFMLDTYFSSTYTNMILETIYSSDGLCYSIGNYDYREYYQIISSTAGDANINPDDKDILFNTQSIPNGTYTLSVTAKDAAMNETIATMTIGINNTEVGILGQEEDMQFSIFPNPSNGYVNIENAKDCTFSLTDISGRKLKQFTSNDNNYKLDISSLNNGIYFLVLDGNGKHLCKKIVKL
jgi:murein DD-endopeptidase MepM/ murein hydrolase activator NlpD